MGELENLVLQFDAPRSVSIRKDIIPQPAEGQVLVQTILSAISPGTEMLIYRGEVPLNFPLDEVIGTLSKPLEYPLTYGYACVGEVVGLGPGVEDSWVGKIVYAFHPHQAFLVTGLSEVIPVPKGIPPEEAVFLANMETAVSLCMDGNPLIGEVVVVFGQGIVGLLTVALLAQYPLKRLITIDRFMKRRQVSLDVGADSSLPPDNLKSWGSLMDQQSQTGSQEGADLVFELSGNPRALDQAIEVVGANGRIVVGSWYGTKKAEIDLGGRFHRDRIRVSSSQVSNLAPGLTGRWTKQRRFDVTWDMLHRVGPSRFITHQFDIAEGQRAYRLIDQHPEDTIQVVFRYG